MRKDENKNRTLTPGQSRFVAAYREDYREAAEAAGVAYGTVKKWMCLPEYAHVRRAIAEREEKMLMPIKVNTQRALDLLGDIALNEDNPPAARVQALDKILKAQGAYIERVHHTGSIDIASSLVEAAQRLRALGRE